MRKSSPTNRSDPCSVTAQTGVCKWGNEQRNISQWRLITVSYALNNIKVQLTEDNANPPRVLH